MADYPGVDPDGLIPGGLQIAGKVNAGALAVLGQSVIPPVFGWGSWSGDNGVNVPHGTDADLPLDTEIKALKEITFSNPDTKVTFNTAGTYLVFAAVFQNTGTPTTGRANSVLLISAGTEWDEPAHMPVALIGSITQTPLMICDVDAGATLHLAQANNTDVDINFGYELVILRLA